MIQLNKGSEKMDAETKAMIAGMGVELTELAVKGIVGKVDSKIKSIKLENSYEEIINELLSDRENAIRIAQLYKNEYEKYQISDKDIEHLHNTISTVLDLLANISPEVDWKSFETFKSIISVDTLKAMQLLGFNYKDAIGVPLTNVCANTIMSIGSKRNNNKEDTNSQIE